MCVEEGVTSAGAKYQILWPPAMWNGQFIVYGHGYFPPDPDPTNPNLRIPDEAAELAAFAWSQNFAFASTSYRANGLVIPDAVNDMVDLASIVRTAAYPTPVGVLATGASEGGAVVTLAAEEHADVFQGALSTCGPTGNFQKQLDYFGDFNVLFNYFFPDVFKHPVTGVQMVTPNGVDLRVIATWPTVFIPRVEAALLANPDATRQLLRVARVPVDRHDPIAIGNAVIGILSYNVLATDDAILRLGNTGTPYNNMRRWYWGSDNDFRLNRHVMRISGSANAREAVRENFETTGRLDIPYVSLHTTGDEIVPFGQQFLYRMKAWKAGSWREHSAIPIFRYGHCNFEQGDLLAGLGLLIVKMGYATPASVAAALEPAARATFELNVENVRR